MISLRWDGAACRSAWRSCVPVWLLLPVILAFAALFASADAARAAGACTIAFGTVPYASTGNTHVIAENSAEQLACDPRYPAADSGVAPPNSGSSPGGGTWSGVTNVSDDTLTYSPHPRWVGPDTYTMYFCNDVNCTGAGRLTATVNVTVAAPVISLTASLPDGTVALAYSQTLTASGGAAPYTFSLLSGTLPTGLSLTGATATTVTLSGTPTAGGTFNFTIRATDSSIGTGPINFDQAYTVTISPPTISISPTTIPNGTRGTAYSQNLTANGGITSYTWSVSAGALPAGISLSAGGTVSGTPTVAGAFNFTARAQDSSTGSGPYTGSRMYSFNIAEVPPIAGAVAATVGHNSANNAITLNVTGGPPTGVTVASAASNGTATASGTSITYTPAAGYAGPDSFTYTATNTAGTSPPATVTVTVSPPTLALSPATLPDATIGAAYSQTATASGGQGPFIYSISVGTLPSGLGINSATGVISGTPTATGTSNFTVRAQDSSTGPAAPFVVSQPYSLIVLAPPIAITSPAAGALPGATGGVAYSQTFTASGGQGPYSFTLASGALPAGVTLTSGGVLSGTATAAGTFNFTLTATDTSPNPGPYTSVPVAYSLTVAAPAIAINPTVLPAATTAVAYSETITASGGTSPHTFSITGGTLPAGLLLTSAGALSGTPSVAGTFNLTVAATDALGFTASRAYSIIVSDPVITIASPAAGTLPAATGGVSYSQAFTGAGGQGTHSFGLIAGGLPPGLTFTSAGILSGTPTASGTFNFTLRATDASPAVSGGPFDSAPVAYSLTVNAPGVTVSPTALPGATTALAYSQALTASGGTTPYNFSLSAGSLPPGLSFTSAGLLSGSPTVDGTYNFSIIATDALGFAGNQAYTVVVSDPAIVLTSPSAGALPAATGGMAYSQTFTASGGQGTPSFSLIAGALPPGMTFTSAGVLSGTPTIAGTYNFNLTASDASPGPAGPFTSTPVSYTLTVNAPAGAISPSALPPSTTALPFSQVITASGGTAPYTYSLISGTLPIGMSFSSTGVLAGNPNTAGTYAFTVQATDSNGFTGTNSYTSVVTDPAVAITAPAAGALPAAEAGSGYPIVNFIASGGNGSYIFMLSGGSLPPGLSLTSAGVLSGTPSAAGTYSFSITPRDTAPPGSGGPFSGMAVSYTMVVNEDDQAPVFTSFPDSIAQDVDYPASTATVSWTPPTATDNQPGVTVTQTSGPPPGSAFPLGNTVVSYEARDAAANVTLQSFTVSVTQRQPGRVTFVVTTIADGAFNFSSSEPALNFTVNTASGSGTSAAVAVRPGSHDVAFTVPAGFDIASVTCSDPASTFDPSTRKGTLVVLSGIHITCTISASDVSQTTDLIGSFLEARAQLIIANGPGIDRRIERLTGAYSSPGGVSGFGLGFAQGGVPFAVRLSEREAIFNYSMRRSQVENSVDARIEAAHGSGRDMQINRRGADGSDGSASTVTALQEATSTAPSPFDTIDAASVTTAADPAATPFDIWIEGKLARFSAAGGDGRFGIVHAGADYLVTPRLLVGLGAQLDWTNMDGKGKSSVDGTGYLIGPYMTARLTDRIFLDARAAWGRSSNTVSPFGTYSDNLDATRWLISGALIGRFDINQWTIEPTARLSYFEEQSEAYKDSLGFDIPAVSAATGTLEFGPRISYRIELPDEKMLEPFASLEGIWTFKQDNTATVVSESPGLAETGLRGRSEVGFSLSGQAGSSLSASAFYDGIGSFDFESWGAQIRLSRTF